MQWCEPTGYAGWHYHKQGGLPEISKMVFALSILIICIAGFFTLSPELRLEYRINELAIISGLGAMSYLGGHLYKWLNAKFDFVITHIEITDSCIYRDSTESGDAREPRVYLNEIKSCQFELIKWQAFEFYCCRLELTALRSGNKNYFQFAIQKNYFETHQQALIKKLNGHVCPKVLMGTKAHSH